MKNQNHQQNKMSKRISSLIPQDLDDANCRVDELITNIDFRKLLKKQYGSKLQYTPGVRPIGLKVARNSVKTVLKNHQARERLRAKLESRKSQN